MYGYTGKKIVENFCRQQAFPLSNCMIAEKTGVFNRNIFSEVCIYGYIPIKFSTICSGGGGSEPQFFKDIMNKYAIKRKW